MRIIKKPNVRNESYYVVSIKADCSDGNYVTTIREYTDTQFDNYVQAALLYLWIHCIGEYKLFNNYDEILDNIDIPRYDCDICHTINSIDDVKIMYFDKNGMSYNVQLI